MRLKMPKKSFYPRTVKSKGFLSYIEYILSTELKSNVRVLSWKTKNEKKSALFIVEQIIYFLQKRVPFGKIKQRLWKASVLLIRADLEVDLKKHNVLGKKLFSGVKHHRMYFHPSFLLPLKALLLNLEK